MGGAFHVPHITNLFGCSPSLIILADLLAHAICLIIPQVWLFWLIWWLISAMQWCMEIAWQFKRDTSYCFCFLLSIPLFNIISWSFLSQFWAQNWKEKSIATNVIYDGYFLLDSQHMTKNDACRCRLTNSFYGGCNLGYVVVILIYTWGYMQSISMVFILRDKCIFCLFFKADPTCRMWGYKSLNAGEKHIHCKKKHKSVLPHQPIQTETVEKWGL